MNSPQANGKRLSETPAPGKETNRPATLEDVAKLAGVAKSTVSRALSNPGRVNQATRAAILESARSLGYTANIAARRLRVGHSRMLLLLLPPAHFDSISDAVRGIEEEVERRGYGLLVSYQTEVTTTGRRLFELALGGLADGILVLSITLPEGDARKSILSAKIPIVALLADPGENDVPSVTTNDHDAMYLATAHLVQLGHRRFFYISGPVGNYHEIERFQGVIDCLHNHGIARDAVATYGGNFRLESGYAAATSFLALQQRPSGVICCSDTMAIGFMKGVKEAGLRIPEDTAIVGFDGIEFGQYCQPTLTTCHQPMKALGIAAARLLIDIVEGRVDSKRQRLVIDSVLTIGGSTIGDQIKPS